MLTIDGSIGEGGGQMLRSSLALSLLTQTPMRIVRIRAKRSKPGLMRQHLACVNAAAAISDAVVEGAEIGATEVSFRPGPVGSGDHTFAINSAGSTTLVFQTVLLPLLLRGAGPSTLTFGGGTHNPMAPPFEFIAQAFLPLLARMGGHVAVELREHGFYPAGGGEWVAHVHPTQRLERLELLERGALKACHARALVSQVPAAVAMRELDVLSTLLAWDRAASKPTMIPRGRGPGNALIATVESEHVTEVFTGLGERGVRAEDVAAGVANDVARYLAVDAPVSEHLADQLVLPMALGDGGVFRALRPTSEHLTTQVALLEIFLGISVIVTEESADIWRVEVPGRATA